MRLKLHLRRIQRHLQKAPVRAVRHRIVEGEPLHGLGFALGLDLRAVVAEDLDGSHDRAIGLAHRLHTHVDGNATAHLVHQEELCLAWLAVPHAGRKRTLAVAQLAATAVHVTERIFMAVAPDHLLGLVPSQPSPTLVPVEDLPVAVDEVHTVAQTIQQLLVHGPGDLHLSLSDATNLPQDETLVALFLMIFSKQSNTFVFLPGNRPALGPNCFLPFPGKPLSALPLFLLSFRSGRGPRPACWLGQEAEESASGLWSFNQQPSLSTFLKARA